MKMILMLAGLAALALGVSLTTSCGGKAAAAAAGDDTFVGSLCTVQFRRDLLGVFRDLPVGPTTGSVNGVETSVTGKVLGLSDQWLILGASNPDGAQREYRIPREVILLLVVERRS